ncbi:Hypothetical Protein FCC1311_087392 [Hondaea fermentalgiana]|uniref:Transmembrane protein n=1 Tax=Hondaea fermentalgiana TaxID=2315210 RepID=A0A2R5GPH0_9STRA|nr:Hypothetical Protein FCC1311_087392 [Hondaea fermentalgiana]|eukprot:GBG32515.1 Hypothetical Protein FCC1311_087392 [Hondaea fermentalgiana]
MEDYGSPTRTLKSRSSASSGSEAARARKPTYLDIGEGRDAKDQHREKESSRPFSPVQSYEMDLDAFEAVLRQRGILRQIEATFNLIAIPLLIMAVIGVGFILVWAEEILVPFVIALFFTYLLKPLVNLLTTPLHSCTNATCLNFFQPRCFRGPASTPSYSSAHSMRKNLSGELNASFDHVQVPFPGSGDDCNEEMGDDGGDVGLKSSSLNAAGGEAPLQMEMTSLLDCTSGPKTGGESDLRSRPATRNNAGSSSSSSSASAHVHASSSLGNTNTGSSTLEANKALCWRCRHFRCPRWLAILICMLVVIGFFAGIVVIIADAIQTFEEEDIERFEERTVLLASSLKDWVRRVFGIDIASLLQEFRKGFHWVSLTQTLVFGVVNALEYVFIIFLFVLYMLFENSESGGGTDAPRLSKAHSRARDLRRQIDMQIQRYIVIKVLISLAVGVSVYVVLGPLLNVKMAHVFGLAT